jgi:hypothetical protein
MHLAKQTQNYFSLLASYLKKFPTDAIVAFLKKFLPSCGITLDCGPEKIEGGRRYIILAAIGVATGAPKALCQSLILLKPTQREGQCAFRTLMSSVGDNMPTGKQTEDEYNTYGGDAIELHPGTFQVRCRCGLSSLVAPCLLPPPAFHINTYHHFTRSLQLPTMNSPAGRAPRLCRPTWSTIWVRL